jgi:hypothetical protein
VLTEEVGLKRYLSKSRIQSGRQCPKRLWLEVYARGLAKWDKSSLVQIDQGTEFGRLARDLLGPGVLIKADHSDFLGALAETKAVLSRPREDIPRIFEGAFEFADVRVRVDALSQGQNGNELIEIKSATSVKRGKKSAPGTGEHIWDAAIQTWVVRGSGTPVQKVLLGHIDNKFVYESDGDYNGLLTQVDITADVEALLPQVPELIAALKEIIATSEPTITTGAQCTKPYPCPFFDHCRSSEPSPPEYPLTCLPRARALIGRLLNKGYRDIRDLPENVVPNDLHKRIVAATKSQKRFISPDLTRILESIPYPRFYLDFETVAFATPRWIGTRPYQQVPFQFSCHKELAPEVIQHDVFLDLSGACPLAPFADRLIEVLGSAGPIIVWNESFERLRIQELARAIPTKRGELLGIVSRLVDLLPIYREHYYDPGMRGSWSIKAVLPTVAADLRHSDLEISDGGEAQAAYVEAIAPYTSAARRDELRANLLSYCERDTLAMLRLTAPRPEAMGVLAG